MWWNWIGSVSRRSYFCFVGHAKERTTTTSTPTPNTSHPAQQRTLRRKWCATLKLLALDQSDMQRCFSRRSSCVSAGARSWPLARLPAADESAPTEACRVMCVGMGDLGRKKERKTRVCGNPRSDDNSKHRRRTSSPSSSSSSPPSSSAAAPLPPPRLGSAFRPPFPLLRAAALPFPPLSASDDPSAPSPPPSSSPSSSSSSSSPSLPVVSAACLVWK